MQATTLPRTLSQILLTALAASLLIVTGVLLVGYALVGYSWYNTPFMGLFVDRDLTINHYKPLTNEEWPALETELKPGDRIIRIDGVDVGSLPVEQRVDAMMDVLNEHELSTVTDRANVSFLRDADKATNTPIWIECNTQPGAINLVRCGSRVNLRQMSTPDMIGYGGIGLVTGTLLWLVTLGIFIRQPGNPQVRTFTLMSTTLTIFMAGHIDTVTTHQYVPAWLVATSVAGGVMIMFAWEFPYRFAAIQRNPVLAWTPPVLTLVWGFVTVTMYLSTSHGVQQLATVLALTSLLFGGFVLLGTMLWRRVRSASPIVRNQSTMVIIGLVPVLLLTFYWVIALIASAPIGWHMPFAQLLPVLFPFGAIYAAFQYRLLDTDRIITQSALYSALLGMMMVSYWLAAAGITLFVSNTISDIAVDPIMIVAAIFLITASFIPLRMRLQNIIDAVYYRERRQYQRLLEQFARDITNAGSLAEVNRLIHDTLDDTLAPAHIIMFVRNASTHEHQAQPNPLTREIPTDIIFSEQSGLIRYLWERASVLYLEEGRPLPLDVVSDRPKLAVLGAPIIVGLRGQSGLNGLVAIGPRKGNVSYLHEDLRFIESLSDQIAIAVERAQAMDDLERRVRVQDVLSQVSRALNFAIEFDTLLELIYAQTIRVIDAENFYIALRNPNTDELQYVFYAEGDDRNSSMEGKRWRMARDLISVIARTQQTIRTDDYVREAQRLDPHSLPENPYLKAWMGVPLLADTGAGVLGVMVAASTQPRVTFSDDQQDLFWDIANLASSAIDKLQLFDKTQARARQLAAINEISNQLATEMGNVDRLLHTITESAVQILEAEAGSLLLVDEETNELEFHVVVGGSGEELIGTRLPAGAGLVGATVQRGAPIIVNDTTRDARWYGDVRSTTEEHAIQLIESGNGQDSDDTPPLEMEIDVSDSLIIPQSNNDEQDFQSGAILSVPLMVSGRAIGVLQTLNKKDGSIFVQEDADLLETFAGQAAVAIENARLFDMTDQQLALRVQELDTMQRIDQELNRTLKLENVVDITIDWAIRKSGAAAGSFFIRDRDTGELIVVAAYNYPPGSPLNEPMNRFPADYGVIGRVVRTRQPSLITDVSIDPDYVEMLPETVAQLTVPLMSANNVIGVINLESNEDGKLGLLEMDFVTRLAEHASPAIVNSQLFQEIEAANQDKSTFVSLVAHELKNPMTSMKGYTDLLLKGVVGPVNEQQAGFLNIIFGNVNRMETLVSDLNDLTKQETGNMRLEISPTNFRNIVTETLRALQHQIEDKDQNLILEVPENLPLVLGDATRLIQAMTNFVSNAYKYTPAGGEIEIFAEATRNTWDPKGPQQVVHCYVRDTGIGMSEDDLKQLFVPYFRTAQAKDTGQPGTGLGMTITKGLIEQHGGQVWVESELEVGSTFHFTVPIASEKEQEAARAGI